MLNIVLKQLELVIDAPERDPFSKVIFSTGHTD